VFVVAIIVIVFPVKVACGIPGDGYSCNVPYDSSGNNPSLRGWAYTTYDIEPFIVAIIESQTGKDSFIKYFEYSKGELYK